MKLSNHGGKRKGAGRPTMPERFRSVAVTIRLRPWLVEWLRARDESQAQTISNALVKAHRITPPDEGGGQSTTRGEK